ncbi:MAG TPA: amidohydrolase family protein [Terriglobales bacterium]|nr:amidohydrolase family protein [Terriglobales bacterium]
MGWVTLFVAMKALLASLVLTLPLFAQTSLSPEVRAFVSLDASVIVFTGVRVVDGTGAAAREDQTVILSGGKIQTVGPTKSTDIPDGARVVDRSGYTVMPGLVGMHDHLFYPAGRRMPTYNPQLFSFPRLYLAGGVTTIRTTGSVSGVSDLSLKQQIDAGKVPGPKMYVTAPYLEGAGAYTVNMGELKDADDARRTVAFWAEKGATSFKAYMHITHDELAAAIEEAHKRGLKITGHLCSVGFREAAALGIDDLEHGLAVDTEFTPGKQRDVCPDQKPVRETLAKLDVSGPEIQQTIRELVAHKVAVTSTLSIFETFVPNRPPLDQRVLDALCPDARVDYLARRAIIGQSKDSPWPVLFPKEMQFEREFAKAGGLLLSGEDPTGYGGVIAGFGDQRQLELLVEAGFTPLEAIKIATYNGAQFLGASDQIGSIAPGKQADLLLIKGDPSRDIHDIEHIEMVFKDGIGYDPGKLIESVRGSVGMQ